MPALLDRVVVMGAGVGGVAAAAAARSFSTHVTLLERDALATASGRRRGVPQGGQLHNLLGRAQVSLEELLPGVLEALECAGAVRARVASETFVFELGVEMPRSDLGRSIMSGPQPVIESTCRSLLMLDEHVDVIDGCTVEDLVVDANEHVAGVILRQASRRTTLPADLVVDATGAQSRLPLWLDRHGFAAPQVTSRANRQWYVSAKVRRPAAFEGDPAFWLVFPTAPRSRGGLVSPAGPRHWQVSLNGRDDDPIPTTWEEFRAYAASLEHVAVDRLLASAELVEGPVAFRRGRAQWRRYDLLDAPVPGLVPIGDAVATLDPLFGQGISLATWQAVALAQVGSRISPRETASFTREFCRAVAATVSQAWNLGSALDSAMVGDGGISCALAREICRDPGLHARYVDMWHLLLPARSVLSDDLLSSLKLR